jgi:hypothetical protein
MKLPTHLHLEDSGEEKHLHVLNYSANILCFKRLCIAMA